MDDEYAKILRTAGASEEDIQAALAAEGDDAEVERPDFEVYEDAWNSAWFFTQVCSQWHYTLRSEPAGFSVFMWSEPVGLNFSCVESAARMTGIRRSEWPALFQDLKVMEQAVLMDQAEWDEWLEGR